MKNSYKAGIYIKFWKNKSAELEEKYKNYKNLFEKPKIKSKKNYYDYLLNNRSSFSLI